LAGAEYRHDPRSLSSAGSIKVAALKNVRFDCTDSVHFFPACIAAVKLEQVVLQAAFNEPRKIAHAT
jgi:hypothetical protein